MYQMPLHLTLTLRRLERDIVEAERQASNVVTLFPAASFDLPPAA